MAVIRKSTPYGYVIFAEDIRAETGGTFSIIGVPPSALAVPAFPALLPRFAMSISYAEAPDESDESLAFAMFLPGTPESFWRQDVSQEFRKVPTRTGFAEGGFDQPIVGVTMNTTFSPLPIPQPGILRVVALRGDDQINLGALPFVLTEGNSDTPPAA